MWLCRLALKHPCTVGDRLPKYKLKTYITFLGSYVRENQSYSVGMHRLIGNPQDIKEFFKDFRSDADVVDAKLSANIMIATERNSLLPIGKFSADIFFQKPVFIDMKGIEHWEFFSYDKAAISTFLEKTQKLCSVFEIKQFSDAKLTDFYFPHAIPRLTARQKRALELAITRGYYTVPRRTTIRDLAREMDVSKSAYHDFLRRAESKVLVDLMDMQIVE